MTRPLVLLANDDGQARRGIRTMHKVLSRDADVVIVAPEVEQSAASHALSLHRPLRLRRVEEGIFAVDGTPADCVYVALQHPRVLGGRRPDLVVSGLNHGLNLGQDVFYSGTVAAAREGALRGIPAIATSAAREVDREQACEAVARLAERVLSRWPKSARAPLLNVNFPPKWNGEMRVTRIGIRHYEELVDIRKDPRGHEYFWLGGAGVTHAADPDTDTDAHDAGAGSITPLVLDLTAYDDREAVRSLLV